MNNKDFICMLVEDNPAHAELVIRGMQKNNIPAKIVHIVDGEQALDYLYHRNEFSDPAQYPKPELILLDLRLPKIDGIEVLETIKKDKNLLDIPVVILTTSSSELDVSRANQNYANSYLVKPLDFKKFSDMIGVLGLYWVDNNFSPSSS